VATEADDRLAEICLRLTRIERELARVAAPVEKLTPDEVCGVLKKGPDAVDKLLRRHFSDARPENERRPGCRRLAFSDEVRVYALEGLAGLRRYRREAGRATR
jgi:hypothetical protein